MTEPKSSDAHLRAVQKYKQKVKRITIEFHPTESELWEHLQAQDKKQTYIKDLIRADMQLVRCKDCEYYVTAPSYALNYDDPKDTKICRSPNLDYDTECGDQWQWTGPDDFCSCGKKK